MVEKNPTAGSAAPSAGGATGGQGEPGRIVVGIDGSRGSVAALRWAVQEAELRGAIVHPVIAWQMPSGPGATLGWGREPQGAKGDAHPAMVSATAEVRRLGQQAIRGHDVKMTCEAVEGHPAEVLVRSADGATALVVGSRGHGGFVGMLLGSVSQQVVAHARCPVVLIPDPERRHHGDHRS